MAERDILRVANSSGFFGDRFAAPREMIDGGPIDVLTGDYLAELTMAILMRQRRKDPDAGYARTFLDQLEDVLVDCADRGIKVVSNAGGLNPTGLAERVTRLAADLGIDVRVAAVTGDDLMPQLGSLSDRSTGEPLSQVGFSPVTANAYLGGWGIAAALEAGADVVITGRVTDAALTMGPAAWRFGWERDDWDALAGALVAGHVIECGPQATGGNFSFFQEVPGLEHPGFPIAEIGADGSAVITKHPGTGGLVSIETVTAQLLYEVGGPGYVNPDVIARLDTVELTSEGTDRIRISGVVGELPPATTKVAVTGVAGYRNSVTFLLTGLDIEEKAALVAESLWQRIGGRDTLDEVDVQLMRTDREDPPSNVAAMAYLQIAVTDVDEAKVGRRFSSAAVELALANYPGLALTAPPGNAVPRLCYRAASVDQPPSLVTIDGETQQVAATAGDPTAGRAAAPKREAAPAVVALVGRTVPLPLGALIGARSGDKGGDANVGVWARSDTAFHWLDAFLTVERLRELVPETVGLVVERHRLQNLRALNFVMVGLLGSGVADSVRWDPQAKGLGEYLRARIVDIPERLLDV
jgi:hypothetical protein